MEHNSNRKIKIALGDLRHATLGRHSVFMPVGIGYIAAYMLKHADDSRIDLRLYDDPDVLLNDVDTWKPDVLGLSNYCWNTEVSQRVFRYAKEILKDVICVSGGPEFYEEKDEIKEYLAKRKEIDLYVYREGEIAFTEIVKKVQVGLSIDELRRSTLQGVAFLSQGTGELTLCEPQPRIMDMDEIPSPYLTGLMDQFFNGHNVPSIETSRGCPFTCAYCKGADAWFSKIGKFSLERIKAELDYICERMRPHPNGLLAIYDSNFGMTERDEEIAIYIRGLMNRYNWPSSFALTTGKRNHDRILRIASILKNRMSVTASVQSLHPATLDVIKRQNLPMDEYIKIQKEIKSRGMPALAELIIPMPMETKASFHEAVKQLFDVGADTMIVYTTMLLKGTYLSSRQCKAKYAMDTRYRIVPRQFGEYKGEKCFEVEEVCVATNTMSFDDYLECRGFAMIVSLLSSELFDIVRRHLRDLGVSTYDYLLYIFNLIRSGKSELSDVYSAYIRETVDELWNSEGELVAHFSRPDNYRKLLAGEGGDNLLRKYRTRVFEANFTPVINMLYSAIEQMAGDKIGDNVRKELLEAKRWIVATRNVTAVFHDPSYRSKVEVVKFAYDIKAWYLCGDVTRVLSEFKKEVSYRFFFDTVRLNNTLDEAKKLYGNDFSFAIGKVIINWGIKPFWRECEYVETDRV